MANELENSAVFGEYRTPTELDKSTIKIVVKTCPIAVFQELNLKLNERGFQLGVTTLKEASDERVD